MICHFREIIKFYLIYNVGGLKVIYNIMYACYIMV